MLLSSAILYAAYLPYAAIFQRYMYTGDESELEDLVGFLVHTAQFPVEAERFWFALTALSAVALFLVLVALLLKQLRPKVSTYPSQNG